MNATIRIDSKKFETALKAMSRETGIALPKVIDAECSSILTTCANRTKVAKKGATIKNAWRLAVSKAGAATAQSGNHRFVVTVGWKEPSKRGRMHFKPPGRPKAFHVGDVKPRSFRFAQSEKQKRKAGGKFTQSFRESAMNVANAIQRRLPVMTQQIDARRGLAVASWIQAAMSAGIKIGNVTASKLAAARGAMSAKSGVGHYRNGKVIRVTRGSDYGLRIENTLPYNRQIKMDSLLRRTMNGRVSYFKRNIKEGVFRSAQHVQRAYPGLEVTR